MQINDRIIYDGETKTAVIMRDGIYHYLASEVGATDRDPNDVVKVYRDKQAVVDAYDRFRELRRLPLTINHPDEFLNLTDEESYKEGVATTPNLGMTGLYNTLGCKIALGDEAMAMYKNNIKELSCGWEGRFEKAESENYDYVQHFVDFNHIAILPDGRGGSLCSIIDNNFKILNMIKDIEELKPAIADIVRDVMEETKNKDRYKDEDKKESMDEDMDEKDNMDEDKKSMDGEEMVNKLASALYAMMKGMEDEDKTEDEDKENMDEDKKENEDMDKEETEDEDERHKIGDFSSVLDAIEKGAISVADCKGKSVSEIKKAVVKKLVNKEISDSVALDAHYNVALENYSHPSWAKNNKIADAKNDSLASSINNINFLKK